MNLRRIRSLFRRNRLDAEMREEMRAHIEEQTRRNIAGGMDPDEARFAAERAFGNVSSLQERARETRGWPSIETALADFRFALRMLRKHPGYTVSAVLTLALGIGFVTTLFTMINGVTLKQLPFEDASRIVSIDVPAAQFDEFSRRQDACEVFAFIAPTSANVRADAYVSRYSAAVVSVNFLDALHARPALGRGFLPGDGNAGALRTVLIGHDVWRREFEGDPSACGSEIRVNGETCTVVGVMPEGFGFPFNQEIWIARRANEPVEGIVFGRLREGVTARQAAERFTVIARGLKPPGPGRFVWDADTSDSDSVEPSAPDPAVSVVPFAERTVKQALRVMLSAVMSATFLVLLLACANVANLVLARAMDRRKELAVRAVIGATRPRLIRQMLTESFIVAALGAIGGFGIAAWTTAALWNYMMQERPLTGGAPFWMNFEIDGHVFAFVALIALVATVATGLVPALQASRVDLNAALKNGAGSGTRVSRFTHVLVNVQMAFSVCLVTVAGLFVTVMIAFNHKRLPYDPAAVFTARISLDGSHYDDPVARRQMFDELVERLREKPGVEGVGLISSESLRSTPSARIEVEGAVYARERDRPDVLTETVSPEFLDAFGVGLQSGRNFTPADTLETRPVALINSAFAERLGPQQDWIGRRFRVVQSDGVAPDWITIVGVVPDLGSMKARETTRGAVVYRPAAQQNERSMTLLMRGKGDVSRFLPTVRGALAVLDPDVPVARPQTVQEIIELERIGMNSFSTLFIACGVGALLLASVGVYGVVSLAVRLRTREFGVRMALGAQRREIACMVFGQGAKRLAIGLGAGLLTAIGAATVLQALLLGFGRTGYDFWVYVGVLMLLASVASAALLIPARRAAKVDPVEALRAE